MHRTKIEIFWDDQDPKNEGWHMRVTHSANGQEESDPVDGAKDESIAILAQSAAPYVNEGVDPSTLAWERMPDGLGWTAWTNWT